MSKRGFSMIVFSIVGLVALASGAPAAAAEPASPDGPRQPASKTARISVAKTDIQQVMSQARVRRADGTEVPLSSLEEPGCWGAPDDESAPRDWEINVVWWYDTATRLTQMTSTTWTGETLCENMNYISMSSNIWFRNVQRRSGSFASCGTTANFDNNHCGNVDSDGIWECAGVGNCSGDYHASFGWSWVLPVPYGWSYLPSSCIELSAWQALCAWTTPTLFVPHVN